MPKNKITSMKQLNFINLIKKIRTFIKQLLKADLRLSIYPGFQAGKNVWMRPMFPNDRFTLEDCFTDSTNMQYFGKGKVWSKSQIEETFIMCSKNNLIQPNVSTWTIITHQGFAGVFFLTRKKYESGTESNQTKENRDNRDNRDNGDKRDNKEKKEIKEIQETKEIDETAEIGYCLRPSSAGRGHATEAGLLVIDSIASSFNGLFFATAHPKNKASQRVLEKMGLKPDETRQNVFIEKYNAPRNFYQMPNRL